MERIKQALERAREEQAANLSTPRPAVQTTAPAPQPSPETGITYSQTRIQQVSSQVLKRHRVISGTEQDEITTAYKMLRTQVLQSMMAKGWKSVAITSPRPDAGKTLTAINLAISLAREVNHTVLLVDLDLRRPSLHTYLGLKPEHGIADFLLRDVPLHDILVNPGIERLVVLPGKEPIYNSSEMLKSPKMVRLVDELKSRYPSRLIVCDLPPLLSADDALAFSPHVDAVLLVIEEGKTTRDEIYKALDFLSGSNVLGTVLNKSQDKISAYY